MKHWFQKIEWNKVTWYSKAAAVVLFLAVFVLGFCIGRQYVEAPTVPPGFKGPTENPPRR